MPVGTGTAIAFFEPMTLQLPQDEHLVKACNDLLHGEMAAGQTYGQAILKYEDSVVAAELRDLRSGHADSVIRLSECIRAAGGEPEERSGAWGVFAMALQGAANLFGEGSAVEALQRGEETMHSDYEDCLRDEGLPTAFKSIIYSELLPRIAKNIASLERLETLVVNLPEPP